MTAPSHRLAAPAPIARASDPPLAERRALVVGASLQRDLFRLGVVPCVAVALALTGWFTQGRLATLEAAFVVLGDHVACLLYTSDAADD